MNVFLAPSSLIMLINIMLIKKTCYFCTCFRKRQLVLGVQLVIHYEMNHLFLVQTTMITLRLIKEDHPSHKRRKTRKVSFSGTQFTRCHLKMSPNNNNRVWAGALTRQRVRADVHSITGRKLMVVWIVDMDRQPVRADGISGVVSASERRVIRIQRTTSCTKFRHL